MKKYRFLFLLLLAIFITPLVSACDCSHEYGEWQVRTAVECETDGLEYRVCSKCNEEETRPIAHKGHQYGEWTTTSTLTCYSDGVRYRICSECEYKDEETTTKLAHEFTQDEIGSQCKNCKTLKGETSEGVEISDFGTYAKVMACRDFTSTTLVVPAYHNGLPVTQIVNQAFSGNTYVEEIYLPSTITNIGEKAFYNCSNLKKLVTADTEETITINKRAFTLCYQLESVVIGDGPYDIKDYAFSQCYRLKYLELGTGRKNLFQDIVSPHTFDSCFRLVNIVNKTSNLTLTLGSGSNGAVAQYARKISTTGDDLIEIITDNAGNQYYSASDGLHYLDYIGESDTINIPNGIVCIDEYAIIDLTHIKNINLSSTVKTLSDNAFVRSKNIETLTLNEGLEYIGGSFISSATKLTSLVIPSTVKTIAKSAFYWTKLTSITFSNKEGWLYTDENTTAAGQHGSISSSELDDPTVNATNLVIPFSGTAGEWSSYKLYREA